MTLPLSECCGAYGRTNGHVRCELCPIRPVILFSNPYEETLMKRKRKDPEVNVVTETIPPKPPVIEFNLVQHEAYVQVKSRNGLFYDYLVLKTREDAVEIAQKLLEAAPSLRSREDASA